MSHNDNNNDGNSKNENKEAAKTTQMSFKDWKMHKEVLDKNDTPQKRKPEKNKRSSNGYNKMNPPPLLSLNFDNNMFFGGQNYGNGYTAGMNFNGNGYSQNNFNNGQNNFNNGQNNFTNGQNNFNNGPNNLNNCQNNFNNGRSNFYNGGPRGGGGYRNGGYNNVSFPDSFFNTDGFYRQKDMIQETIAENPFRYNLHANQLLKEFKYSTTKNMPDKKKSANKPRPGRKENEKTKPVITAEPAEKTEPKIFIKNPRKEANKPYIPMPKPPETEITGTLEERKQEWKDYREAMKPFKNREFYNAKRVVQRLGKKDPSELDEKEQFRLSNAQEKMSSYKQKLSEKYDHYIQSPDKPTEDVGGELFVLKRGNQTQWTSSKSNPEQFKNYGNFGESSSAQSNTFGYGYSGRKILGGTSKYSTFVSGGTLENSITQY